MPAGISKPQTTHATNIAAAKKEAEWILLSVVNRASNPQSFNGAIGNYPDNPPGAIRPYQAAIACIGLARATQLTGDTRFLEAAWTHLTWHQTNLNVNNYALDWDWNGSAWVNTTLNSMGEPFDSTDAYAGTALLALLACHQAEGDSSRLAGYSNLITKSIAAIDQTMQLSGLPNGTPLYHAALLMDSTEVYAGLRAGYQLAKELNDEATASKASAYARKVGNAINTLLWNRSNGTYDVARNQDNGVNDVANLATTTWHAAAQAWAVWSGVAELGAPGRSATLMNLVQSNQPTWITDPDLIATGWGFQKAGQHRRASTAATAIRANFSSHAWPYTPMAAGELIVLLTSDMPELDRLPPLTIPNPELPSSSSVSFSDFVTLGHSLAGSYGAKADEKGWPARLAASLGAELFDRHVDGAVVAWDDTSDQGDGGYFTCASYLDPKNQAQPYTAQNPLVSIYYGHNDHVFGTFFPSSLSALKASLRGCIGHARLGARFPDNHASVRRTGPAETGGGAWTSLAGSVLTAVDAHAAFTTAGTDEVHIDVPQDFPGGAIWIFTLTGASGNSTANGAITAGQTSLLLTSGTNFPSSGRARVQLANGDWDTFTYTGKSTNTLTGIPSSGADALQTAPSLSKVASENLEGGAFTVDVDGNLVSPPATQAFDTRGLGIPAVPGRIAGHGWRIPVGTPGAHEVTLKLTAIGGGATPFFYFNGWGIEAVEPPVVVLPLPVRCSPNYPLYAAYPNPVTDATIATLRTAIKELADEFDDHVFTIDADAALNKVSRYFYQPAGTTLNGTVSANATTITVVSTTLFPASGLATIYDGITEDIISYTGKTGTTLTGVPSSGALAATAHATGLRIGPSDGIHLSDEGHEVAAAAYYGDIQRKAPRRARLLIATQRRRPPYSQRATWKAPVRAASVGANVTISAPPTTLDGVTLARGDRVLLKDQTVRTENGVYFYVGGSPPLIRDYDTNSAQKLEDGCVVPVTEGTVNRDTVWSLVATNPITIGTTNIYFTRILPDPNSSTYRSPWEPPDGSSRVPILTNMPRDVATASAIAALSTGRLTVVSGVVVPAGQTITAISFFSGGTAAVTPTNQWFSLLTVAASPITIRSTTNGTTGAWAANAIKTLSLSSTWMPEVDTPVMIGIMVAAATVPTLSGAVAQAAALVARNIAGGAGFPVASSSTAQTTPPADGTTMASQSALSIGRPYALLT